MTATLTAALAAGTIALGAGHLPARAAEPTPAATTAETTGATTGAAATTATPPVLTATLDRSYDTFDAHQAVAVDKKYFYAVDNQHITKHDKATGRPLLQFAGDEDGPIIHMDSAAVVGDKLYTAHSNYSDWPMESSIEVYDTRTLRHIETHSFGIYRGSLTWLDRHDGAWWAGFANYDKVQSGQTKPYGETYNTQVVKMDDDFRVVESWTIPKTILDRFKPMSNSGGSWGPDGRLWLTGHDLGEAYVMKLPAAGSDLEWVATVTLPGVEGQGIAWDRSGGTPTLWTIKRSTSQVLSFTAPYRSISDPAGQPWRILGPGQFEQ
ncbi:hypothetical protein JOL79_28350 [Microbispora sp. RL4-1S]|uniref:WD40 repeat domain-containing protein n=1 Tax=Microbispora oryzae TaxID=2806554 RepID=A0A940WUN2_9ACTN|nr:hypothetical protein [Microbispora oryzae]MBP2707700.1 hypothetical protein [Microbispora oryzae]